jgi:serine/threonine protein kinase
MSDDEDSSHQPNDEGEHDLEPMQFLSYIPLQKAGEGTFSRVLRAQHLQTGRYVAIKCMKAPFPSLEKVNKLREIQALKKLSPHPNIIKLLEVLYDQENGKLALVMELMERNVYEWIRGRKSYISEQRIKAWLWMLLKGIEHMHRNGIFHRDIKPENILLSGEVLKLADFGSCRSIHSKHPYTEYISTRWYRAPECLLTDGYYGQEMDMWGVGCVFYEIVTLMPLFPGKNEIDQIHKIHEVLGTPSPELLAQFQKHASSAMDFNFHKTKGIGLERKIDRVVSKDCIDLMKKMLAYNPSERITAKQAIKHPYFKELRDNERRLRHKQRSVAKMIESQSTASNSSHNGLSFQSPKYINAGSDISPMQISSLNGKILPNVSKKNGKIANSNASESSEFSTVSSSDYKSNQPGIQVLREGDLSLPVLGQFHQNHTQMTNHANKVRKYPYFANRSIVK